MPTILLVESDPLQALLRKSSLESELCDVYRASDAAEALCLVEQPEFTADLALVISGQHIGGIGGPEFVAELHLRLPELRVLVLDSGTDCATDYERNRVHFLSNPFTNRLMVAHARQMLVEEQRARSAA
jgi:DNA-binding NtrC family response regulator